MGGQEAKRMFDEPIATQPDPRRIAIVSTYDELCGIAGYTRALEQQLRPHAEIQVFDLDQYLLRSPHGRVQRLADKHIKAIADQLHDFDSVNIQLEYGTLGRTHSQILRRFVRLVRASRNVSVTFHTILGGASLNWAEVGAKLRRFNLIGAIGDIARYRRGRTLSDRTYKFLRVRQRWQQISIIVHNRRDGRLLRDVFRLRNVEHHPLSFIAPAQAREIRSAANRHDFPILTTLPENVRLIGTFGFLSPYKGYETALRALKYLPDDYHLLIFGGIHPQVIEKNRTLDPYIRALLDESHIGHDMIDTISDRGAAMTVHLDAASKDLLARHPNDLQHRVHFMGVHNDEGFMRAMALCDTVVLPYLEVGQSSSGPIAMALEMGCRVIASRTHTFLQYARYHPERIEFFDIGNYAELADLLRADRKPGGEDQPLYYNTETNAALYLAMSKPRGKHQAAAQPQAVLETAR
jgi:glycosyltransferase involved in cell wall biosynthesis